MRIIKSQEDFDDLLTNRLVVVKWSAGWCMPCTKIAKPFAELAEKYPDVVFAKGDIDELEDCDCAAKIKAVPTFRFFREGTKIIEVTGGNIKDVENAVVELIGQPEEVSAEPESEEQHKKEVPSRFYKKSHHRHSEKEIKDE